MTATRLTIAFALSLVFGLAAFGQEKPKKAAEKPKEDPVLAAVTDDPKLPRVLLIGDSISMGYTLPVRKLLEGKANVHRPGENCGPTTRGIARIDQWLGDGKWDVIHFNFGLHDLKYADEKGNLVDKEKGKPQVSLEDYEKHLRTLVARLKKTNAKLIWCATTPVPAGAKGRVEGDEVKYNEVAAKVMKEEGVAINDLYAFAKPKLAKIQRAKDVHFSDAGSKVLAEEVAKVIEEKLK
jgi:acyl-CoA thioesterase-1